MAQTQTLKRRIKSVGNTRQITKAMELVSASKMRRAQEATLRSRPYATVAREVLERLTQQVNPEDHPLFTQRSVATRLLVVITSDKGLAGAYNSNLLKLLITDLTESKKQGISTKLLMIGQKGAQFTAKLAHTEVIGVYTNWPTEPTAADVQPIVATALSLFTNGSVDTVQILYTDFISTVKQSVQLRTVLPLTATTEQSRAAGTISEASFEPSAQEVLDAMVPRLLEMQIYQANLEAIASEHSMRMMAMKNASDNAKELIDDLTLTFNSARQASITQELAEITSGAEAIG